MSDRRKYIKPQNATEAWYTRAVEELEVGRLSQSVACLCNAVRLLDEENRRLRALLRGGPL